MSPPCSWDKQKATTNRKKHGVTLEEAQTVKERSDYEEGAGFT
jgi:uncharacterized DUF497 family protein